MAFKSPLTLSWMGGVRALRWCLPLAWCLYGMGLGLSWWPKVKGVWPWAWVSILAWGLLTVWLRWRREVFIREAPLPLFLRRKLRETYPAMSTRDAELVERGMRQFFGACLRSRGKFVGMPSRAVDAMWHEFILHTRAYRTWCDQALGHFLHHTPAEVLGRRADRNDGLRRAWFWACKEESIDPNQPSRLPLLFALDAKLGIAGGFHYVPDCSDIDRKSQAGGDGSGTYCGTSFGDSSFAGDADGFGGVDSSDGGGDSDSSDGGGDGGGCGGGGD